MEHKRRISVQKERVDNSDMLLPATFRSASPQDEEQQHLLGSSRDSDFALQLAPIQTRKRSNWRPSWPLRPRGPPSAAWASYRIPFFFILLAALVLALFKVWRPASKTNCSPRDLASGSWVQRPRPASIAAVHALYHYRPYRQLVSEDGVNNPFEQRPDGLYCLPKYSQTFTEVELAMEEERILQVASWEWQPTLGCTVRPWAFELVLQRLLESAAGILFIGGAFFDVACGSSRERPLSKKNADSITAQQFDALALAMGNQGPIRERALARSRRLDATRELYLDPDHADFNRLVSQYDIPNDRLTRPIATIVRNNYLVTQADVPNLTLREQDWLPPTVDWYQYARKMAGNGTAALEGTNKLSILVINTGAWWTASLGNVSTTVRRRFAAFEAKLNGCAPAGGSFVSLSKSGGSHFACELDQSEGIDRADKF
jgi:hypothetical protein